MDGRSFDELTVGLASGMSRRRALTMALGAIAGLAGVATARNASAAQECAGIQEACEVHEDCCEGYFCGETGICIAGAECVSEGGGCEVDDNCCDDMICTEEGICAVATSVEALPNTGSGSTETPSTNSTAAVLGAAGLALAAGATLRRRHSDQLG